ncbi:hypothetical protein GOBAR_DD03554 [Gossypium barbadense]|nr:hypothetical protein GOBAR_DD03554 [Gossypium barbadense]
METLIQLLKILNTPLANPATVASLLIPNTQSYLTTSQNFEDDLLRPILSCLASQPYLVSTTIPPNQASKQQQLPNSQHRVIEMQEKMCL